MPQPYTSLIFVLLKEKQVSHWVKLTRTWTIWPNTHSQISNSLQRLWSCPSKLTCIGLKSWPSKLTNVSHNKCKDKSEKLLRWLQTAHQEMCYIASVSKYDAKGGSARASFTLAYSSQQTMPLECSLTISQEILDIFPSRNGPVEHHEFSTA